MTDHATARPELAGETALYRLYDESDVLLYVGITTRLDRRMSRHADDKPWWPSVARIDTELFPTRREAMDREARAITQEEPLHNVFRPVPSRPSVKVPRPTPPQPVLSGDPDDLLGYAQIAELLSTPDKAVKPSSVRGYRTRGQMPEPDDLSVPDRPRWRRDTITAWIGRRPGKGHRTDLKRKEPTP